MGKPKTQWVSAPTPPEMQASREALGNFFGTHGLDYRGQYPGQINAAMNPYLSLVGSMLAGIYSAGTGGGGGFPNQGGSRNNPLPNMTWNWPTMPTSYYTGTAPPPSAMEKAPVKEEPKKGPKIFAVTAK